MLYSLIPMLIVFETIAFSYNATLASGCVAMNMSLINQTVPVIYPFIRDLDEVTEYLNLIKRYSLNTKDLGITITDSMDLNFLYCDVPKYHKIKPWNLSIFTKAFRIQVWLLFIGCIFAVSTVIYLSNRTVITFYFGLFVTARSIFPSDPNYPQFFQHSGILSLWLLTSLVLTSIYAAIITCTMTMPPSEDTFSNVTQLLKSNFSLITLEQEAVSIALPKVTDFSNNNENTG